MCVRFSILVMALFALGGSGQAFAESPGSEPTKKETQVSLEAISLDSAFEKATSPKTDASMTTLCGPTTMDCRSSETVEAEEICVVTVDGLLASMPAAIAPN